MGTILLHNPWVHVYLLCVGALCAVHLLDYLFTPRATRDGARTSPRSAAQGEASHRSRPRP